MSEIKSTETVRIPAAHIAYLIEKDLRTRDKYKDAMVVPNNMRFKRSNDKINSYTIDEVYVKLESSVE